MSRLNRLCLLFEIVAVGIGSESTLRWRSFVIDEVREGCLMEQERLK